MKKCPTNVFPKVVVNKGTELNEIKILVGLGQSGF